MKNIFVLVTLSFILVNPSSVFAKSKINVPENISYYEYCYISGQCKVPLKLKKLITANIMSIKLGKGPIY